MHILSNKKLIKTRTTWSGRLMLAGFGLILGSAVLTFFNQPSSNKPSLQFILPAYAALFGGFIVFNIGASSGAKWRIPPRPDQAVATALKGMDNKYRLYNYLLPAEHVLLTPNGVIVFQVRRLAGNIACDGDKWDHQRSILSRLRFGAEEQVGTPTKDIQQDATLMKEFLAKNLEGDEIPLKSIILFSNPNVKLTLINPTVPVVLADDLKAYIRQQQASGVRLDSETWSALAELFDEAKGAEEVEDPGDSEPAATAAARPKRRKTAKKE